MVFLFVLVQITVGFRSLLTGRQVILRPIEREDLKTLHKWQNDEEIMRLARSFPDNSTSLVGLEAEYDKVLKGEDLSRHDYIIEEKTSKRPVGWGGLRIHTFTKRMTSANLGLALGEKDSWNKGYGTEIVELLLKEAFEQLNLQRTEWWTFAENIPSLKLAAKMGFIEEGRLRNAVFFDNKFHDMIVLGQLKDEYASRKKT